ncbi:MAG: Ferredoxin-dependent bilin reductase [bacterium]|nr:Ferredoxin-dependent bilin reductase [bacterium]
MLEGARDSIVRQLRVLEELVKARLEVDVPGMVAGVRARVESRLHLAPLPIEADLASKPGPFGLGSVRTWAWECPEARKVVLSHIGLRPVIEGLALVIHPANRAVPIFGADLMALPTRLSVNADVYGAREITGGVLEPLGESFGRLRSGSGPEWAQPIASGAGLHAKPSPRLVDDAFAALTAAVGRYLDVLATTKEGTADGNVPSQRDFFTAFHANGPRKGPLGRLFGAVWAERYSRLIFE